VESWCGLRFPLETCEGLRVSSDLIGQELQCNKAVQPSVFGLVHHAHAAAAQLLNDAVMRDGLADHGGGDVRRDRGASQRRGPVDAAVLPGLKSSRVVVGVSLLVKISERSRRE